MICTAPGHAAQIIQGLYQRTFETRVASCSGVTAESDGGMLADRRCMNMQSSCETKKNTTLYHFLLNEKMLLLKGGRCFFLRSFLSLISGRRVFLEHLTSFCVDCQRPVDVLTSCCRLYFICCSYFDRRAEKYIQCRNA